MLYFDHNATHPISPVARAAWLEAVDRYPGNPSSPHRLGSRADAALERAREQLAEWLGCEPEEIVWTSGATEANNMALRHLAAENPEGEAWISAIEHPSLLKTAHQYFPGRVRLLQPNRLGQVERADLEEIRHRRRPALVALMAANNETGVLQPWPEASRLCMELEIPFLCDASQWIGRMPVEGLGRSTFVSGCAHKYGGLPGVGFLKCPRQTRPLLLGGGQEEGRRAGTENVPGILASMAALAEREARLKIPDALSSARLQRDEFMRELARSLPGVRFLGAHSEQLWNTISVVMPEIDCRQRWVVKLDKLGAAVSTGSACSSGHEVSSHVLAAMGLAGGEAGRILRLSSGWETTPQDWGKLLQLMQQASAELTAQAPSARLESAAPDATVAP